MYLAKPSAGHTLSPKISFQFLDSPFTMSAIRSLRQLSLSSSRVVSARSVSCVSRARFTLPARQVLSSRAFSVSARAWGQGTSA